MSVANFEERIDICPNDPRAYYHMGWWWHAMKQYAKAMVHYDHAISLQPAYSEALRDRASLQAACPDAEFRNGTAALKDARMVDVKCQTHSKSTLGQNMKSGQMQC
ncbi:hypothetical protein C8R31_11043 [Nitrosospira sp. Nsp2]|uniref:tetratricopeptide repeat protein n=1 Tax=Nitrosospira sp. Nsp2 TaxID=136548 RepID=UPI000D306A19|nr:tetratricopeptide repeat protein [Nitrosospira sp. Nsp2]PTR13629.1 hypothetical protein C8R31_11043 [Nitrosospira sp. Nsp2]